MLVLLNDGNSTICVNSDRVSAVRENEDGDGCFVIFDAQHQIKVQGTLAKVLGKLNGKT